MDAIYAYPIPRCIELFPLKQQDVELFLKNAAEGTNFGLPKNSIINDIY